MEEQQQYQQKSQRRRRCRRVLVIVVVVVVLILIVALVLGLVLRAKSEHDTFKQLFLSRCEATQSKDCAKIWSAFEQAYVGKDPCAVPPEAYGPLLQAAPFTPACNRMLFWSKTKDLVHDFTDKRSCHVTLEDTLLGTVLDDVTWCGKEGSNETVTSVCPGWSDCDNNPVRSFWNKASASYAEVACGNVSVMLNGSILTPFSPGSIFASVEVKHFNPKVMKSLDVILVTQEKVSNCTNASLKDLQKQLAQGIAYSCQEVPESQVEGCASDPAIPCGACW